MILSLNSDIILNYQYEILFPSFRNIYIFFTATLSDLCLNLSNDVSTTEGIAQVLRRLKNNLVIKFGGLVRTLSPKIFLD